jgi:hypothetical protein
MKLHLALAACLLPMRMAGAQSPAGYHVGAPIALPDSVAEVWNNGGFRLSIRRVARNPKERELIEKAERLYPDSRLILGAARNPEHRMTLDSLASGLVVAPYRNAPRRAGVPADRWWLDEFDATWIAFAITAGAVDYYAGRLRDLAAGRGQFSYPPGGPRDGGMFDYAAHVERGSVPGVAFVVQMQMRWDYYCGPLCGMGFSSTRSVSFDAAGNPVAVGGDRRPMVVVS